VQEAKGDRSAAPVTETTGEHLGALRVDGR
jgi:hypothetical protein